VLCFDKTGTLTRNELHVQEIIPLGGTEQAELYRMLGEYVSNLANRNTTVQAIYQYNPLYQYDPLYRYNEEEQFRTKQREIPFTSARKWGAIVFEDETLLLGAADRLMGYNLDGTNETMISLIDHYAERGMRVLVFARTDTPPDANGIISGGLQPLALIVLSDQIRDDIQETLNQFRDLKVGLKILSGDHLKTVKAIAEQAGLPAENAYTGDHVDVMSDGELDLIVRDAQLFARISPDGKQRVIKALQKQGEYVAMVGDGVNDVPALKAANLAVVMNNGAQIAKDVADIILLNNAMTTLPLAFSKGKEITQTVYATAKLFLAKNMFATLLIVLVGMMLLPFPISPVQMSVVTLFTANLHAALYPFGLLRPKEMKTFRHDVLDYVVASGVLGAVHMAILYFVAYVVSGANVDAARSAIMCFGLLYGLIIFWNTQGIELTRPRSLIEYKWSAILAGLFAGLGLLVPYIIPQVVKFVAPTPELVLLIAVMFLLNVVLLEVGMRQRHLLNVLWKTVEP
jgi:cation-transporting ATPase E